MCACEKLRSSGRIKLFVVIIASASRNLGLFSLRSSRGPVNQMIVTISSITTMRGNTFFCSIGIEPKLFLSASTIFWANLFTRQSVCLCFIDSINTAQLSLHMGNIRWKHAKTCFCFVPCLHLLLCKTGKVYNTGQTLLCSLPTYLSETLAFASRSLLQRKTNHLRVSPLFLPKQSAAPDDLHRSDIRSLHIQT